MRKQIVAVTIDPKIIEQTEELEKKHGTNFSHVVRMALVRMYEQDFGSEVKPEVKSEVQSEVNKGI